MRATFFKLTGSNSKPEDLLLLCSGHAAASETFEVELREFSAIPTSPFSYWISQGIRSLFSDFRSFESIPGNDAKVGLQTSDDARFIRAWWEVRGDRVGVRWFPFGKGESVGSFYGDVALLVGYSRADQVGLMSIGRFGRGADQYFRPGLTWALRASRFSPRALPDGCIFSNRGQTAFSDEGLTWKLAFFNSKVVDYLFKASLGRFNFPEFPLGVFLKLPNPSPSSEHEAELSWLAEEIWRLNFSLDNGNERSHAFVLPGSLLCRSGALRLAATNWSDAKDKVEESIAKHQSRIDAISCSMFALSEVDRAAISGVSELPDGGGLFEAEEDEELEDGEDPAASSGGILSWAVGVAFGRFDVRLATGERSIPPVPDMFGPLPAKSPGMLPDGDALFMPCDGVLVDDPGHKDDVVARVTAVHDRVGEVPPAPDELRRRLAREFFPAHIRMYSKSRRKAPIYWQLATPSASYSVWLYIHAFGKDTLFRVLNDYVGPKVAHERRQLEALRSEAGPAPTSAQSRTIEAQAGFVEELSAMLDEVQRVAPLWDPELDDGVIINFAPLWRLVPHNAAWRKELRATWDALVAGDYDWARLPMRLWPERVVSRCANDRSLAIAHDLEDVFWFEDADGKWKPRPTPTRTLDDLIAERTSSAVQAALKSLFEAPEIAGGTRKRGRAKT